MRAAFGLIVVATLFLLCTAVSHAATNPYTNPGFETGDTAGWTLSGPAWAAAAPKWNRYVPAPAGTYFGLMGTFGYPNTTSSLSQQMSLDAGDKLDGWAAWYIEGWWVGQPVEANHDSGALEIYDGADLVATPWSGVMGYCTDFEPWSWTAPSAGNYTLTYVHYVGSGNGANNGSAIAFDAPLIDPPNPVRTPEPGTMALLLMGLPMGALLWRRRK